MSMTCQGSCLPSQRYQFQKRSVSQHQAALSPSPHTHVPKITSITSCGTEFFLECLIFNLPTSKYSQEIKTGLISISLLSVDTEVTTSGRQCDVESKCLKVWLLLKEDYCLSGGNFITHLQTLRWKRYKHNYKEKLDSWEKETISQTKRIMSICLCVSIVSDTSYYWKSDSGQAWRLTNLIKTSCSSA